MSKDTSKRPVLKVRKRKILGRKVKSLRKEGVLPANIYGRKIKSLAIESDLVETQKIFGQMGETGLVDVVVEGEKEPRPALFHNPQTDPVTDKIIHLDFYQVDLSEKVTGNVPIEVIGEAPVVTKNEGVLVRLLDEIEVEALPTDLPEKFTVDVSKLEKVDQGIAVEEIIKSSKIDTKKVTVKTTGKQLVVKIELPTKEKVAPPPEAAAAPAEGEAVPPPVVPAPEGKPPEKVKPAPPQPPAPPPSTK